ncbi:MAG: RluA family pseudouridine synthase, partial [Polaromonas sp.]|nr:RluA family pseudouridine synthase [Polaromonas sp.]
MKHIIGAGSAKTARPGKPANIPETRHTAPAAALQNASAAPDQPALQATFVTVDEDSAGQRLDNFLIRQLKG